MVKINSSNQEKMIEKHSKIKMAEMARIVEDLKDENARLKKELDEYKIHTGEMD